MNTPNTQVALALKRLRQQISLAPTPFSQLWQEHASLWQTLAWSEAQARLYLRCLPGVVAHEEQCGGADPNAVTFQIKNEPGNENTAGFDLADEMVSLLNHAGRPMPLAQLLNKMPPGRVLTEAMLRTAAAADPRLTLAGPTVRLA
ncbi:MAG: hypothetical protein CVU36_23440 [Betaproteobacteria bacterium HGW-Betaproteobacteria-9]|jgi:hypothetical protein|nr:MAG: hypothetical protein CVU36_23440 [Betaproteobacteria bacterium HGW-Betaproteobacteria-9]